MSNEINGFALPTFGHTLVNLALVNATLRALVASHPAPAQLDAALDREFGRALSPTARPEIVAMRDAFLADLRSGGRQNG
ncbi:hypothetical protein [Aromatoleum evansii]|uniref:hypothetical protein n=1 Tax=Aromatoleum evansii TaxID=59406 RepID=UPI00145ED72E|nr:hypothetical protein [Aromatoleum evansii]NMG30574.1 hypothetical protein [Aromatoleum evansii]